MKKTYMSEENYGKLVSLLEEILADEERRDNYDLKTMRETLQHALGKAWENNCVNQYTPEERKAIFLLTEYYAAMNDCQG